MAAVSESKRVVATFQRGRPNATIAFVCVPGRKLQKTSRGVSETLQFRFTIQLTLSGFPDFKFKAEKGEKPESSREKQEDPDRAESHSFPDPQSVPGMARVLIEK